MVSIDQLIEISKKAGDIILKYYDQGDFSEKIKDDKTPVTSADIEANEYIVESLKKLYPSIPIIAEESDLLNYEQRKTWHEFFLVDPLDGTKEFIKHNDEFTVNIALHSNLQKKIGVVWAPVLDLLYYADGENSFKEHAGITSKLIETELNRPLRVMVSRSHINQDTDKFIERLEAQRDEPVSRIGVGSSLKFCYIADGTADIYPRLGPIKEWDIAAGSLVLSQAGGVIKKISDLGELAYNKPEMFVEDFFATKSLLLPDLIKISNT